MVSYHLAQALTDFTRWQLLRQFQSCMIHLFEGWGLLADHFLILPTHVMFVVTSWWDLQPLRQKQTCQAEHGSMSEPSKSRQVIVAAMLTICLAVRSMRCVRAAAVAEPRRWTCVQSFCNLPQTEILSSFSMHSSCPLNLNFQSPGAPPLSGYALLHQAVSDIGLAAP